ncbi:MAG: hypothetical protein ABEI07_01835, partial [Candidatus Nanohaloarchaea archaeon]
FFTVSIALDVAGAYGLEKVLEDAGHDVDVVSGPITDTTAGVEKVEETVGVPALNAFREEEVVEVVDLLEKKLEDF